MSGDVVVVTGAGGAIGSAVAVRLAGCGASLLLNDRRDDALQSTLSSLPPGCAEAVMADVTTREGASTVVDAAVQRFGSLSVLVNVAGGLKGTPVRAFMDIDDDQFDFAIRVNARSTFQCMQAALRVMIPARAGRIVNFASTSWSGTPEHADYGAAKAAVVALTRSVATQVGVHGINVNAVAPGLTVTPLIEAQGLEAFGDASAVPLGRFNRPADIAEAVAFLCSPGARNISGQLLTIAGGWNPSL